MGTPIYDPPLNQRPLTIAKKFGRGDCLWPLSPFQIWCKSAHGGGLLSKCVKYSQNFIYLLIPFLGTHLQVRHVGGFSRLMTQTTRTYARVCLLGIHSYYTPFMGSNRPKPQIFRTWIGVFKPNRNYCIDHNQNLHSDKDDQVAYVGGPNTP